jgi:hypothetical protein
MRISAHNRNIETGRFYNLDRHERVCSMCNLNVHYKTKIYAVNVNCLFKIEQLQDKIF